MFTLTAKMDYAIKSVTYLADHQGDSAKSEAIAAAQGIPHAFLRSILTELKRAGLVGSMRGANGGHWLLRPAEQITLLDIIAAVEPRPDFTSEAATRSGSLQQVWERIHECELQILEAVTISDLLQSPDMSEDVSAKLELRIQ